MLPALAHSRKITRSTMAKTNELLKGLRAATRVDFKVGLFPIHNCRLTEYKANPNSGATKMKPDSMLSNRTHPPTFQANQAMKVESSKEKTPKQG